MANQHSNDTFKAIIEAKYDMPIDKALRNLKRQGVTLKEVAEETGFKEITVKKYALRYNCILKGLYKSKDDCCDVDLEEIYTKLRSDRLNRVNVLSRSWQPKKTA